MNTADYLYRLALAAGIGLLIGVQREAVYDEPEGKLFAGARTFALMGIAGYLAALAAHQTGSGLPIAAGILALTALMALSYREDLAVGKAGMTTEMAATVAYGTGSLCYWGLLPLAAAVGVTVTALLSLKHEIRSFTHAITSEDIYATVKFAVISVIVLPLLPNRNYGPPPWDIFNPYKIWLMVVFISGIGFSGYVLIKLVGARRGIGLTGLLGGLASSTAVTVSFAQRSRENRELARPFASAIILAWAVMFVRVLVVVLAFSPSLVRNLMGPLAVLGASGLVYSAYLYFAQASTERDTMEFSNPFELGPAIRFGLVYAGARLVSRAAQIYFGDVGIYVSSFIAGLVDVNAITLSLADLAQSGGELAPVVAERGILIAAGANTLFKGGMVLATGSPELRRAVAPGYVLLIAIGLVLIFLL